jgi:hypothetical protein
MEADISIWRKTGHFYFALTRICQQMSSLFRNVPILTSLELSPFSDLLMALGPPPERSPAPRFVRRV